MENEECQIITKIENVREDLSSLESIEFYHDLVRNRISESHIERPELHSKLTSSHFSYLERLPPDVKDYLEADLIDANGESVTDFSSSIASLKNRLIESDSLGEFLESTISSLIRSHQVITIVKDFAEMKVSSIKSMYNKIIEEKEAESKALITKLRQRVRDLEEIQKGKSTPASSDARMQKEIDKLKLKVITLEKQNDFLVNKCHQHEKKITDAKPAKKKRTSKKNVELKHKESEESEGEGDPVEDEVVEQEIISADPDEEQPSITDNYREGVIMVDVTSLKQKKKPKKKAATSGTQLTLENLAIEYSSVLMHVNSQIRYDERDPLFYHENYFKLLSLFLEIISKFDSKRQLLKSKSSFIKEVMELTHKLIIGESKVHFDELQELVVRPRVLPIQFISKNPYWTKHFQPGEKGINAYKRVESKIESNPDHFKLVLQEGVTRQIYTILTNLLNSARVEFNSFHHKQVEDMHFKFESEYPVDKDIRVKLKAFKGNVKNVVIMAQIMILSLRLMQDCCPLTEDDNIYIQSEMDMLFDEANWKNMEHVLQQLKGWSMSLR